MGPLGFKLLIKLPIHIWRDLLSPNFTLNPGHIQPGKKTSRDFVTPLLNVCVCVCNKVNRPAVVFFPSIGAVMWQRIQICWVLFALYSAAPPAHINRLALFPDKSAWCEAKNITQIVGHTGCQPRSIQNRSGWRPSLSLSLSDRFSAAEKSADAEMCFNVIVFFNHTVSSYLFQFIQLKSSCRGSTFV